MDHNIYYVGTIEVLKKEEGHKRNLGEVILKDMVKGDKIKRNRNNLKVYQID